MILPGQHLANRNTPQLDDPVSRLNGVGIRIEEKLNRLAIHTVQDLLFHLPYRYVDRTHLTPIGALLAGQDAYIQGTIELAQVHFGRRRSLLCRISDGTGAVLLRFFHFSKAQQNTLKPGVLLRCYGQVRKGPNTLEMIHPEYQHIDQDCPPGLDEQLTPVYPSTGGLQQRRLRNLSEQALNWMISDSNGLAELLPDEIRETFRLPDLVSALRYVHRPPPEIDTRTLREGRHPAQQRLAFEELLSHHLGLRQLRDLLRQERSPVLPLSKGLVPRFLASLPFSLTPAQQHAVETIQADLQQETAMLRLVQGDVGCGKTVVAAHAVLQAIEAGYQVALMAPTELLAEQHYATFSQWLAPLCVPVLLLSGKLKKSDRAERLARLNQAESLVIIGTHALFQEQVTFARLGLVIIDEQHRFGVHQRLALLEKGIGLRQYPHQLIMTATPIPRTLAMTIYADLDNTVIDELPPNRQAVTTRVISMQRRDEVITRIAEACAEGRQVYWVCTLIEESETLQCQAAIDTCDYLQNNLGPLRIDLIHGRMKNDAKEYVMREFKAGAIQLLVATTVIEVGVDVPNASLMVIENAERLGLAQLHQLRGRIGRSEIKSDCVLLYQPPLGDLARTRLETMRNISNGFEIARKDLELRGPGEFLGTRQTGLPVMRIADLMRDAGLLPQVQKAATLLINKYPDRVELLIRRWLGDDAGYGNV
ncbi:MAG: ATP-dependent DNA helicase RecG [Gammaproteobacteria bacterium RBG_16_51_14]|nr:MAG: ATP-dependent DNA helicase RecG [Gammaproteobacteria bacterium RBG_16_51_14]